LGKTVRELGEELTVSEVKEWIAYFNYLDETREKK
jgi:hypothetical protein